MAIPTKLERHTALDAVMDMAPAFLSGGNGKAGSNSWTQARQTLTNNSGEDDMGAYAQGWIVEGKRGCHNFTLQPATYPGSYVCKRGDECGSEDGDRFKAPTDREDCDVIAFASATATSTTLDLSSQ